MSEVQFGGKRKMDTGVLQSMSQKFETEDAPIPFSSMKGRIDPSLLSSLEVTGYEFMTPVQSKVFSSLQSWTTDCLVQAKTGTGKTIAFLLPALQSLLTSPPLPRGQVAILILSPTRELALQIAKECNTVTSQCRKPIECHTAYGGTARASNLKKFLQGNPSVLVATPGRLKDYLTEELTLARFQNIRTVVLDEADRMLEQGFLQDIKHILGLLPPKSDGWQGMCFSATIPDKVRHVVNIILRANFQHISTVNHSEPPTLIRVPQRYLIIPSPNETFSSLLSLISYEQAQLMQDSKIIVFGITANLVALFAEFFRRSKGLSVGVYELHSRLSQNARTRTTEEFKAASNGIMLATDVIGRGMDFPNVTCVVQVGLPASAEQYVHRVGRTARADKDGRAVIILTQAESFFLHTNRQLDIKEYEHQGAINVTAGAVKEAAEILAGIDEITKQKAYSAYLGFMKGFMNKLKLQPASLVASANDFAMYGMGCPEPPAMDKRVVGKMGLKGVPGLRYGENALAQPSQRRIRSTQGSHGSQASRVPKSTAAGKVGGEKGHRNRNKQKGPGIRGRDGKTMNPKPETSVGQRYTED